MRSHSFRFVLISLTAILALMPFATDSASQAQAPKPRISLKALAGSYYRGDGLGVNCRIHLKEDGSFTFKWTGCLGVYDKDEGTAELIDGRLVLTPSKPNKREGFFGMDTEFVPVVWGKSTSRAYLIPKNDVQGFCNAVNLGKEPRRRAHGGHYLRDNDWKIKVDGAPEVPKEWAAWLLARPIAGEIVEVNADQTGKVNLGAKAGVWVGMDLYVAGAYFDFAVVKSVEADSCIIGPKYGHLDLSLEQGLKVKSKLFSVEEYLAERGGE